MSTKRLALPFLFFTLFLTQCNKNASSPEQPRQMRELTSLEKQVVSADNSFGLKLFKRVNVGERGKNVFISPLSVSMALGMTLNGANGSTRDSMERVLELAGLSSDGINASYQSLIGLLTQLDPTVTFQIANSFWYRNTFAVEQPFVDVNRLYFNAEVNSLNFTDPAAASAINGWVVRATNGKINTIVDPPIPDDVMTYLINAVYFKGTWTYEFKKYDTHDEIFYLPGGGQKVCRMMNQKGNHRISSLTNGATLDLPYGNAGFSMTIFLPDYGTDIESYVDNFDESTLVQSTSGLHETDIDIAVPKFKLEYKAS
jgi:serine protease inhibitor